MGSRPLSSTRATDTGHEQMRNPPYDRLAKKRTVALTLNSDLYAKAKAQGINMSHVAEAALAEALSLV